MKGFVPEKVFRIGGFKPRLLGLMLSPFDFFRATAAGNG
jgi:hypothetical protein